MSLKHQTLLLAFILGFIGAAMFGGIRQAYPHDWYSGIRNPTTGVGCCGGHDCHPLMADELNRLTEDDDNYIIDGIWKFPKDEAMPASHFHPKPDQEGRIPSGYHYCIWGGKPRCFFIPQST